MNRTLDYYLSLDYPVEIRAISENLGGGYTACIPSLGSMAFVGDGETPQEAYENLQVAKREIFEEYLSGGHVIPEPPPPADLDDYSGKLALRMPKSLHADLARQAKEQGISLNQYLVYALSSFQARSGAAEEVRRALEQAGYKQQPAA